MAVRIPQLPREIEDALDAYVDALLDPDATVDAINRAAYALKSLIAELVAKAQGKAS